jgi:molybdopterin synthase catalytic subunit
MVVVQTNDFDVSNELRKLREEYRDIGAVVSFLGCVRDLDDNDSLISMTLEHYPGMTEKALEEIEKQAHARWDLRATHIIHRVGTLQPADQIVLVLVASRHRHEAFEACAFLMDSLKTNAPFWKKERTQQETRWVDSRPSDRELVKRWE